MNQDMTDEELRDNLIIGGGPRRDRIAVNAELSVWTLQRFANRTTTTLRRNNRRRVIEEMRKDARKEA